jgi:hypothetical protein
MRVLTHGGEQAAYLEYGSCCIRSCLAPPPAKPVAHAPSQQESGDFDQGLQEHVQERITRHVGNTEDQREVQELYKCSVESS